MVTAMSTMDPAGNSNGEQPVPRRSGCLLYLVAGLGLLLAACSNPSTKMIVPGDREVVQVSAGVLRNGEGDVRYFYIRRDPATGVDYLAVIDAGIVKLDPKPVEAK